MPGLLGKQFIIDWSFGCVEWCCRKRKQLQERSRLGRPVSSDYIKSLWVFQRRACWFCFLFHAMGHILGICGAQSEAPSTSLLVTRRRKRLLKGSRRREILWIWLENQLLRFSPSCREFLPWFAELFSWFSLWFSSIDKTGRRRRSSCKKEAGALDSPWNNGLFQTFFDMLWQ